MTWDFCEGQECEGHKVKGWEMNGNCRWGAYGLSQEMEIQKLGETFKTSKLNNNWSFYKLQVTTCSFNKNHCY